MENTAPALCPVFSVEELGRCFRVEGRSKGEAPFHAHCFHTNAAPKLDEAFNLCFISSFSYRLKLQPLLVYSGQFRQSPAQPHGATQKESQELQFSVVHWENFVNIFDEDGENYQ